MRVLFITRGSLVGTNNSGNTILNIFNGFTDLEAYNLFFREEKPNMDFCMSSCQISEISIVKSFLKKGEVVQLTISKEVPEESNCTHISTEKKIYSKTRDMQSRILWFIREMIWASNKWKSPTFINYLKEVNPNLIFIPGYGCWYPYRVLSFVHKLYPSVPVYIYHFDDTYSLSQLSVWPSYWIYRLILRRYIRKVQSFVNRTFVISENQKTDYDRFFKTSSTILTKGNTYKCEEFSKKYVGDIIRFCYTGNLGDGRIDTLIDLGKELDKIGNAELYVYSITCLSNKQKNLISKIKSFKFMGAVSADRIQEIQKDSDVLVHVESFGLKSKLLNKYSISTKIFDYIHASRCILAIGPSGIASIDYLEKNRLACIIHNHSEMHSVLVELMSDHKKIEERQRMLWTFGSEHLELKRIQDMMKEFIKADC